MRSREFPARPHHRRALFLVAGAFVLLVLGGMTYACYSLSFLWTDETDEDVAHAIGEGGQTVRSFFEMDDEGEEALEADLELALGRVTAARAEAGALFQAEVDIIEGLRPRFEQSTRGGQAHIELGLEGGDMPLGRVRSSRSNAWRLYFSDQTPLNLTLSLGAAEADLDFSGIPLERLDLDCGMAKAAIRFTEANPVVMERLDIEAGLTEFAVRGLGFARFERFEFDGGAGDFTLDFTGDAFQPGASAEVDVGMASLTVLLPTGQPIVLDAPSSFMTKVEVPSAFVRLGDDRWGTTGADTDRSAFRLDIDAGPGNVQVRLVE
ncbi:MAG: hypothetical protein HKN04_08690 [Rhodothermaceae bacterium]|nr:hypothetical protein [Rhodothermaceae bacterium]